jgi:uncharacterized protein YndB with AHSA1/START domain
MSSNDYTNRELRISKVFDVPIEVMWRAWTNPIEIAQWWGPNGFTNEIKKMDFREGGEWLLNMRGTDGKNFPNKSIFREIVPNKKIVFQHFNPNYLATVTFAPKENQTLLDWTMLFETVELFDIVVKTFKADEGFKQNAEKLENFLREKAQ